MIGIDFPTVLPVSLISFEAKASGSQVNLKFSTASEKNNDFFTIERSQDGVNFIQLLQVKGAGNSDRELKYSQTDSKPFKGINYYRLKQADLDGKTTVISEIKAVNILSGEDKVFNIYPNPVQSVVEIGLILKLKTLNW